MRKRQAVVVGLVLALGASGVWAQEQQPAPASNARRVVVTLTGKLEAVPELGPTDFQIELEKQKLQPARVYRPEQLPTVLAIVLQDNLTQEFGSQLPVLRDFILNQPPNTWVGVFYLTAQTIDAPLPSPHFSNELQKVADTLRTPRGTADAAPPTPYDKVAQIVAFMDRLAAARKEVLLFSEGSDALYPNSTPSENRSLLQAAQLARTAGVPVWVIYTNAVPPLTRVQSPASDAIGRELPSMTGGTSSPPGAGTGAPGSAPSGPRGDVYDASPFGGGVGFHSGLSFLDYLTDKSGGKVFSSGSYAVDIAPHLAEFRALMNQQFVLEYSGEGPPKKVKLQRKLKGAKLLAPGQ
ncbi:MAG: hypothetical protein HYY26_04795 [Acidobacteria bacterium]|nr:hypothetical protein [Acidobacteriota bacterium]